MQKPDTSAGPLVDLRSLRRSGPAWSRRQLYPIGFQEANVQSVMLPLHLGLDLY